jgi:hypothetical protein
MVEYLYSLVRISVMEKHLFQQADQETLDRLVKDDPDWSPIPKKRRIPLETVRQLSFLRRSLQALPPRELQFIYLVKVKGLVQEEARKMYSVKQQNISYRVIRASERICLHYRIFNLASETQLRRTLFDLGFTSENVRAITGVVRTSSQVATANALGLSQGSIRYLYQLAISRMETYYPDSKELKLLRLVERNLNQLRSIKSQGRWDIKKSGVGRGDFPVGMKDELSSEELLEAIFSEKVG